MTGAQPIDAVCGALMLGVLAARARYRRKAAVRQGRPMGLATTAYWMTWDALVFASVTIAVIGGLALIAAALVALMVTLGVPLPGA